MDDYKLFTYSMKIVNLWSGVQVVKLSLRLTNCERGTLEAARNLHHHLDLEFPAI